jgi:hypothetical protein
VLSKLLESKDTVYEKFILSDPELPSIEEFLQKIDLSKRQPAGIVQGREIVFDELAAFETTEERLRRYLFTQLSTILPSTRYAFEIATKQVSSISNIDLAFRSRSELFLEMKKRIDNEKLEFQEKYFLQAILPRIMKRRVRLSESIGEELDVYASQDLALDQPFQHCLYGNVPKSLFNDEELEFARFIDRLPGVDWVRNPPKTGIGFPYAFGYFYPDFILFSSASRDRSFSACFIETKGEHLTGNRDSESKKTSIEHLNKILVDSKIVFSGFDAARTFAASFASG